MVRLPQAVAPVILHLKRPRLPVPPSSSPSTCRPSCSHSPTTMLPSEKGSNICYEYDWISGTESLAKYKPGGYHPIMIGDMLHDRYHIVDKLGFGGYSTIWLARDTQSQRYVAVKVGIADSLLNETTILHALSSPSPMSSSTSLKSADRLKGRDSIPIPLDEFKLRGPNGIHPCYTMAPAQCNLKEASYSRLFPLDVARALAAGLALAVAYVHSQGYVHGDIHLRNVLAKLPSSFNKLSIEQLYQKYGEPETVPVTECHGKPLPPNIPNLAVVPLYLGKYAEEFSLSDTHVLLSDFGEAFTPASGSRCGKDCHTPLAVRPPEARFEPQKPLSYAADVWSLAITIWEIIGMKSIFSSEFTTDDEVTSQQVDVLGPMPPNWWERWGERSNFFDDRGCPKEGREVWPPIHQAFEEGVQKYRQKMQRAGQFSQEETAAILHLFRRMLTFRPEERLTVEEILQSDWMTNWALPAYGEAYK